ncbi:MAG TPA: LysE family translocator [Hyphomicrobiaceae bacterium]|nr:LysE family translocator [Hyphomicrobiaceae bacterium]
MSPEVLATFIAACVLLGLTPGPNMSLILANTLSRGLGAGLVTLAGTTTGLALLVTAAAAGMSSVMVFMAEWFDVVRWIGALYLVYLGGRTLWQLRRRGPGSLPAVRTTGANLYVEGVLVSLSNPKVLLFLGAFLPQFIDPARDAVLQLSVLAVLFVAVLAAVDVGYTLAVARARARLDAARMRLLDGTAGVLLLLGGVALAMTRRP